MRAFAFVWVVCSSPGALALPTNGSDGQCSAAEQTPAFNVTDSIRAGSGFNPPNCADRVRDTDLVGDGSPVNWTYWEEVSGYLNCGEGACTIGRGQAWSWSVGFSASGPINRWITGGFSVGFSHEASEYRECAGEKGDRVCVWLGKWAVEYTVQNIEYPSDPRCGGLVRGSIVQLTSPLEKGRGEVAWCGHGDQCINKKTGEKWEGGYAPGWQT